jgi:hypothetical protein
MYVPDTPSALKQIRRSPWKFQQTFKTPLNNLQPFVAAILSAASPESACITIEQAVFEPKYWIDLLTRYSLPPRYGKGVSVTAVGRREVEELLHTAFTDWFDFLFRSALDQARWEYNACRFRSPKENPGLADL